VTKIVDKSGFLSFRKWCAAPFSSLNSGAQAEKVLIRVDDFARKPRAENDPQSERVNPRAAQGADRSRLVKKSQGKRTRTKARSGRKPQASRVQLQNTLAQSDGPARDRQR
jgi:hypothetical protein